MKINNPANIYKKNYKEVNKAILEEFKNEKNLNIKMVGGFTSLILKRPSVPLAILCLGLTTFTVLGHYSIIWKSYPLLIVAILSLIIVLGIYIWYELMNFKNWSEISESNKWSMRVHRLLEKWETPAEFLACAKCYQAELGSMNKIFKVLIPITIGGISLFLKFREEMSIVDVGTIASLALYISSLIHFISIGAQLHWVSQILTYYEINQELEWSEELR